MRPFVYAVLFGCAMLACGAAGAMLGRFLDEETKPPPAAPACCQAAAECRCHQGRPLLWMPVIPGPETSTPPTPTPAGSCCANPGCVCLAKPFGAMPGAEWPPGACCAPECDCANNAGAVVVPGPEAYAEDLDPDDDCPHCEDDNADAPPPPCPSRK